MNRSRALRRLFTGTGGELELRKWIGNGAAALSWAPNKMLEIRHTPRRLQHRPSVPGRLLDWRCSLSSCCARGETSKGWPASCIATTCHW